MLHKYEKILSKKKYCLVQNIIYKRSLTTWFIKRLFDQSSDFYIDLFSVKSIERKYNVIMYNFLRNCWHFIILPYVKGHYPKEKIKR